MLYKKPYHRLIKKGIDGIRTCSYRDGGDRIVPGVALPGNDEAGDHIAVQDPRIVMH